MSVTVDELLRRLSDELKGKDHIEKKKTNAILRDGFIEGKDSLKTEDYPLAEKHPELVKTPTGKERDELTLQAVLTGKVGAEDVRISGEVLEYQAQIAESAGKKQLAENFRRAAELTGVPNDKIFEIYDLLRPGRATEDRLLQLAEELRREYNAERNASLVDEAARIYKKRNILK